jgi:hypothetical protein
MMVRPAPATIMRQRSGSSLRLNLHEMVEMRRSEVGCAPVLPEHGSALARAAPSLAAPITHLLPGYAAAPAPPRFLPPRDACCTGCTQDRSAGRGWLWRSATASRIVLRAPSSSWDTVQVP